MRRLVAKAQQGDGRARRRLVEIIRPRLTRMAWRYARCSREEYEDLLGEGWCAVFSALRETDLAIGQPEEFLLKRARWRMLDYIKWARRRRAGEVAWTPGAEEADEASGMMERVLLAQLAATLSATQRLVLGRVLHGQTWREVGEALGCSSANVAYHMARIRQRARQMMDHPAAAEL